MRIKKNKIIVNGHSLAYRVEQRKLKYPRIELLPTREILLILPEDRALDEKKLLNNNKKKKKKKIMTVDSTLKKLGIEWNTLGE
ncbi:MAG: hypothetical protein ACTSPI_11610, partial [Candidatus Heimdallarchaeaceae archaeon]